MWHMWDDDNLLADDLNLAGLTKKIEEIADNIAQAESDEYDYAPDVDFEDLETEMIAMNVDFWKG
jgi:flagellar basal body rod protein FlgB